MRSERDVTRAVRSWLEDGADRLPERVLDSVLDAVPSTPQRRSWWPPRRYHPMSNLVRIAAVVAALAVAGVVAIRLLPAGGVGSPGPAASVAASSSPSATPDPAPAQGARLTAGTYRVGDPFALPFTITFDADWTLSPLSTSDVQFNKTSTAAGTPWIVVDIPDNVYPDPCNTTGGTPEPPVPSTVDGLVAALTSMVGFDAGPVSDVEINGHAGKSFVLTNSIDTTTANCTGGPMLPMWTFPGGASGTNGGATEQLWILDVDGTPVVIDGETFPITLPGDKGTIESIVKSIDFE